MPKFIVKLQEHYMECVLSQRQRQRVVVGNGGWTMSEEREIYRLPEGRTMALETPVKIYHRDIKHRPIEYIRADVAQAQIEAEQKRIVDAIDAIVGMNPNFDVHLYAQAIKAAVWNDEDDPQEILKRELRRMPK
jgi:hypothetical protein